MIHFPHICLSEDEDKLITTNICEYCPHNAPIVHPDGSITCSYPKPTKRFMKPCTKEAIITTGKQIGQFAAIFTVSIIGLVAILIGFAYMDLWLKEVFPPSKMNFTITGEMMAYIMAITIGGMIIVFIHAMYKVNLKSCKRKQGLSP